MPRANNVEVRQRLAELRDAADRLEQLLADGRKPPLVLVARAVVAVDRAAALLQRHADALAALQRPSPQ
jgi:hypothetical protein